jgi:hypothetical protein
LLFSSGLLFQGEPVIKTGFFGLLICIQQQGGAAQPAADCCHSGELGTLQHSEQLDHGSIIS